MADVVALHLTVAGDLAGEYIIDEELPDGRLVIRPDTSAETIRRRMGGEPVIGEQFEQLVAEHGILAPDDEG